MTKPCVTKLIGNQILDVTLDSRVVSLRWDVIPWCLVMDLDVPIANENKNLMRRAWLCFDGLSEMSWRFANARLPTGIWLTSTIAVSCCENGFSTYRFVALVPEFDESGNQVASPSTVVCIRSKTIRAAISIEFSSREDYGLVWNDRTALAPDDVLVSALGC